jgi:Putative auto-transporter adhesin, head GIN domain
MMRKILILAPILSPILVLAGCNVIASSNDSEWRNAKNIAADDTVIASFQSMEVAGPDDVRFVIGDGFHIRATGDAETLKKLRYRIEDGILMIGRDKSGWKWNSSDNGAQITVTAPSLSAISLAGSGDISAERLQADAVKVELAGSGNVTVKDVVAKTVKSEIAGSGDVELSGKVVSAEYEIAGSGNINAKNMAHADAKVAIVGSGDVTLTATGNVEANIAGSGSVNVTGGAKCKSSTTGSGEMNCS